MLPQQSEKELIEWPCQSPLQKTMQQMEGGCKALVSNICVWDTVQSIGICRAFWVAVRNLWPPFHLNESEDGEGFPWPSRELPASPLGDRHEGRDEKHLPKPSRSLYIFIVLFEREKLKQRSQGTEQPNAHSREATHSGTCLNICWLMRRGKSLVGFRAGIQGSPMWKDWGSANPTFCRRGDRGLER
jgi:hypothetical protein